MIDVDYCRLLARHNRWMNERLYATVARMPDAERRADRGAFFGSVHRTLNHILWADRAWLARFHGQPFGVPAYGADMHDGFADLLRERELADTAILDWAGGLTREWLASTLEYRAASDGKRRAMAAWVAATHLFAHATHHRGQVTTLLAQAGYDMGATDLPVLPGVVRLLDEA
ncbi:MAG: DinB family protein [Burkholderiales bacterium]